MTKENDILAIISAVEQTETALPDLARLIGLFYTSLIKHGVPEDLAKQLVAEWYWSMIMQQSVDDD